MGRTARKRKRKLEYLKTNNYLYLLEKEFICRRETTTAANNMLKWMSNCGFHNDTNVRLVNLPIFGRSLFTSKYGIKPGQCVLTIPNKLLITISMLHQADPAVFGSFHEEMDCLMIFLMKYRQEPQSFWSSYLNMLPQDYSFLPCVWSKREVRHKFKQFPQLPQSLVVGILKEGNKMLNNYYRIKNYIVKNRDILMYNMNVDLTNFDNFLWAYCTANTRCVHLPLVQDMNNNKNTRGDKIALVPFFDFLNHYPKADVRIEHSPENGFQLFTNKRISRFQQVFIKYHNYNNRDLFLNYGFTNISKPSFDSEGVLRLKTSCQDSIPLTYVDLIDWSIYLEGKRRNQVQSYKYFYYSKRLTTLREIEFISPKDFFYLIWPINDFDKFNRVVISADLKVFLYTSDISNILPEDETSLDIIANGTLDWRLDTIMRLMARPLWDSANNIRRLIYSDLDEFIINTDSEIQTNDYYSLWVCFIEWVLKRDYDIDVQHSSKNLSINFKKLAFNLSRIQSEQVAMIIANEIGLLLTIRQQFNKKLHDFTIKSDK